MDNNNSDQSGVGIFLGEAYELVYKGWVTVWRGFHGKQEIVEKKNAVAFLVYNRDKRAVAMVYQERPAASFSRDAGRVQEVPAGHIDNGELTIEAMAREAREELGLLVDLPTAIEHFTLVNFGASLFTSPGIVTERIFLGYAEFNDDEFDHSRKHFGLAEEGEEVERRWIAIERLENMPYVDLKTFALAQWFLREIYPQLAADNDREGE
ncbi:MAG: NUDIX hydrolase [Candidatus Buchananbacteria bacterium]